MNRTAESILDNPEWTWNFDNIYIRPNIPSKKLNAALKSYANRVSPEDVLILADDTVFGGSKEGFIITPTSLHCKMIMEKPKEYFFGGLDDIAPGKQSRITVNGREVFKGSIIGHSAILTIMYRIRDVLGLEKKQNQKKQKNIEPKSNTIQNAQNDSSSKQMHTSNTTQSEQRGYSSIKEELRQFHLQAMKHTDSEIGEALVLVKELIELQMNTYIDLSEELENLIQESANTKKSEVYYTIVLLYKIFYLHSLSKLPDDFVKGMGEDSHMILIPFQHYCESLLDIINAKYCIDNDYKNHSDAMFIIPLMFYKTTKNKDSLEYNEAKATINELMKKLNIPSHISNEFFNNANKAVQVWYPNLLAFITNLET